MLSARKIFIIAGWLGLAGVLPAKDLPQMNPLSALAQAVLPGEMLHQSLLVRLEKTDGLPIAGKSVRFTVSGEGRLLASSRKASMAREIVAKTDGDGLAEVFFYLSPEARNVVMVKAVAEGRQPLEFSIHPLNPDKPMEAPKDLRIEDVAPGVSRIHWTFSANNAAYLEVERTGDGQNWTMLAVVPFDQRSYLDRTGKPGLPYFYRVAAVR